MTIKYLIDDDWHSEGISKHASFEDARKEIDRLVSLPWDQEPNMAPCANWKNCGRRYEIAEYDVSPTDQWRELTRVPIVEVTAKGIAWLDSSGPHP